MWSIFTKDNTRTLPDRETALSHYISMEFSTFGRELGKAGYFTAAFPPELANLPILSVDEFSSVMKAREHYVRNSGSYPHVLVFSYSHRSLYWLDTMREYRILHYKFMDLLHAYISKTQKKDD